MNKELGTISAKLNAHQQSLNALQAVQSDHTKRLTRIEDDLSTVKEDVVTVKTGVHAILDLLDTNLAKKSLADRLAGRLLRRRDDGAG